MNKPAVWRYNLLRAGYLLLVVGLGSMIWPEILDVSKSFELSRGVVVSMLGALSALAVLGLRYPLRMLPLLLFEMAWKAIWLLRVGLPLWSAHRLDGATSDMLFACSMVVVFPLVIPWSYVRRHYVAAAEPWR